MYSLKITSLTNVEKAREVKFHFLGGKLKPMFSKLQSIGIYPNTLSYLAFASNLLSVYFFLNNRYLFIVFTLSYLLFDGLDGLYAKTMKLESVKGHYLDKIFDTVGALFLYLKYLVTNFGLVPFIVTVAFAVNSAIMLIYKIDKETGVSSEFRYFAFFNLFTIGIYWDMVKFLTFTPIRAYLFIKKRETK